MMTAVVCLATQLAWAQQASPAMQSKAHHVFGVVYSFADSTAYISELQTLAVPTYANGQVAVQDVLSERFKHYVMQTYGVTHAVSAFFAAPTKAKAEKLWLKVRKQYTPKNGAPKWQAVTLEHFRFNSTTTH